jgi:hypothetical protein
VCCERITRILKSVVQGITCKNSLERQEKPLALPSESE